MAESDIIPISASVASTGFGIRYVGDNCAAWSGVFTALNSYQIFLSFTTGSGLIIGEFYLTAFAKSVATTMKDSVGQILLNDEIVYTGFLGAEVNRRPSAASIPMLIPPRTKVVVQLIAGTTSADDYATAHFVGRVYGAA